jgi:hypothetical protein
MTVKQEQCGQGCIGAHTSAMCCMVFASAAMNCIGYSCSYAFELPHTWRWRGCTSGLLAAPDRKYDMMLSWRNLMLAPSPGLMEGESVLGVHKEFIGSSSMVGVDLMGVKVLNDGSFPEFVRLLVLRSCSE